MLIGITQRVITVADRGERRDALDQAWTSFLSKCGIDFIPLPNTLADPLDYIRARGIRGIILSGGGNVSSHLGTRSGAAVSAPAGAADLAPERDRTETLLLRASIKENWPVLGVCRGMQAINLFHGGTLVPIGNHAGGPHPLMPLGGAAFPSMVNSFHDFAIGRLGDGLTAQAMAGDTAEAFSHQLYKHMGIMWHPERAADFSAHDVQLFRHFFAG